MSDVVSDQLKCLGDEELADVTLIGTDGNHVPGVRFVLAARSEVFKSMLYGNFKEASDKGVRLGYTSTVLRYILEFCCTDNVPSLKDSISKPTEQIARDVVQLSAAAHFYELPNLSTKAYELACSLMNEHPNLASAIFDEASETVATKSLWTFALQILRRKPQECLLPTSETCYGGVSFLTAAKLRELIQDKEIQADELTVFKVVQKWAAVDGDHINSDERIEIAKKCAVDINLSHIQPSDLSGLVSGSGLVEKHRIVDTLTRQAHQAERHGFSFAKKRRCGLPCVIVEGAGVQAVNGFYDLDGEINSIPAYKKSGQWNGKNTFFFIYTLGENWYISTPPPGQNVLDETEEDIDFYINRILSKNDVPLRGWRAHRQGILPPPKLTIVT